MANSVSVQSVENLEPVFSCKAAVLVASHYIEGLTLTSCILFTFNVCGGCYGTVTIGGVCRDGKHRKKTLTAN